MLSKYIAAAMGKAHYEIVEEDDTYYGSIAVAPGVWANASTLEACREELAEVLEEWLFLRIARGLSIPVIDGIELKTTQVA